MKRKIKINKSWIWLLTVSLIWTISFTNCKDEFSTDSNKRISLSVDTLKIDTIISQTLSPTNIIIVYNRTDEDIRISSILLESEKNYFKINVNGRSGNSFSDVRINSGDSLFIFVQIMTDEMGQNSPLLIEDKIKFLYNGNTQQVVLSAYGQDAFHIKDVIHIDKNTTWNDTKPYLLYDSIIVDSAAIWTLSQGVKFFMKKKATILINGTVKMEGTTEKPIEISTFRKDNYSQNINYDQLSDQWGGIKITSSSTNNIISNTLIKGGAFGVIIDSSDIKENYRLTIANSQIHGMKISCLKAHHANILCYNSVFSNGENGTVILSCGDYRFDHCTIATYTRTSGYYRTALTLSTTGFIEDHKEIDIPIHARFNNCIIHGNSTNEIMLVQSDDSEENNMDYFFDHSLIKTIVNESEDDTLHFNQIIVNEDPMFVETNKETRCYDFHLSEESPCKEKGDLGLVLKNDYCKNDKDGVLRNIEAAPDLGAYQIIVKEEASDSTSKNWREK